MSLWPHSSAFSNAFALLVGSQSAGSGFLMFGLALAYLMAVVPAATQKRQLAVCIWALGKSPDDIIIRAEHPLAIDPPAQLLASVMAKKKAVGANKVVMDLPMGEGTKLPTLEDAYPQATGPVPMYQQDLRGIDVSPTLQKFI